MSMASMSRTQYRILYGIKNRNVNGLDAKRKKRYSFFEDAEHCNLGILINENEKNFHLMLRVFKILNF